MRSLPCRAAIFAVQMFDDFASTPVSVTSPIGSASWIVAGPTFQLPF